MFQGFSQNAIDFLWGISLNNERGWFMAHKQDFTDYVDAVSYTHLTLPTILLV